ncbi:hypothetical protein [Streptomyces sp. S.PB5]|nr:hypothetical protein [Streptomyces sp. S.PB5]MDN3026479.1 hypothetical protein [Streptomyces sp. S.PB5]
MAMADGDRTAGGTRWGVVAAILGLPTLLLFGFLALMAAWVLVG